MKKILVSFLLISVLLAPTTIMAQELNLDADKPADPSLAKNINSNTAVAEVNGEKITQEELNQQANVNQLLQRLAQLDRQLVQILSESEAGSKVLEEYQKKKLDSIIDNLLLKQKAEEKGIELSQQEKEKIYKDQKEAIMKQQEMDQEQFLSVLKKQGYENEKAYKKEFLNNPQLKVNKLIEEEVASDIEVSEEELKKAYQKNKDVFSQKGKDTSFEKLKPQLKQMLKQQKKNKKINEYLSDLKEKADIEKNI